MSRVYGFQKFGAHVWQSICYGAWGEILHHFVSTTYHSCLLGAIEDGARLPPSTLTRVPLDWEGHGSYNVVKGLRFSERPSHGGSVVLFSFSKSITRSVSRCLSS